VGAQAGGAPADVEDLIELGTPASKAALRMKGKPVAVAVMLMATGSSRVSISSCR
jgi:hypothetical protein